MTVGFYGDAQVQSLKAKVDLVELMSAYTPVKKAGGHHTCCCPIHQERSPSCTVYDDGHYHCFGCGAHGDVVDLVMAREHCDFRDAVEFLARRVGFALVVDTKGAKGPTRTEREQMFAAVKFAVTWYTAQLHTSAGRPALEYLRNRGFTDDTLAAFGIGWAPGNGALMRAAMAAGHDPKSLLATNLIVDRNGRTDDFFFERVTFPIFDRHGQPIAFSCRLLPAAEQKFKEAGRGVGKYVNNTDTPLYQKGATVWNLHRARTVARESGRVMVMEGPTDVMAAWQCGITECVAPMGTAITDRHLASLAQLVGPAGDVLLVLDGDKAGQRATEKVIPLALAEGVPVKVVTLPKGKDVSELLEGATA
jgi:DNA primase